MNAHRTLFTFNTHNISEFCFNYVSQHQRRQKKSNWEFTSKEALLVDQCFEKYMHAFQLTQSLVVSQIGQTYDALTSSPD